MYAMIMVTFTIIPQMLAYIPYMDPMGYRLFIVDVPMFFQQKNQKVEDVFEFSELPSRFTRHSVKTLLGKFYRLSMHVFLRQGALVKHRSARGWIPIQVMPQRPTSDSGSGTAIRHPPFLRLRRSPFISSRRKTCTHLICMVIG